MAERICTIEDCDATQRAKGLCRAHYQRAWYERNRDAALAYAKERYDPDAARAKHERRKHDPEYLAQRKATHDRWRTEHPDRAAAATARWRQANRDHVRDVFRAWQARTMETRRIKRRGYHRARRQRLTGAGVDYAAILDTWGMTCHICGDDIATAADLHFDHVIPLARGGAHTAENIRPAHAACNMRKGARIA